MGTVGSLIICISSLPQIVKTYRTKKADDLSISYLIILMLGMTLVMIYSLHIGDPIFIFGNSLSVLSTGVLIFLCLRYRSQFMTPIIENRHWRRITNFVLTILNRCINKTWGSGNRNKVLMGLTGGSDSLWGNSEENQCQCECEWQFWDHP